MQSTVNTAIQLSKALADTLRTANRRQVQADCHHHRAGHHRRHQALDPAGADLHHHQTNQGVNQPAGDDPAKGDAQMRVQPLAVKAGNGDHHPDKAALERDSSAPVRR